MKRYPAFIILIGLSIPACLAQQALAQSLPIIEVYFSPKGGCTEAVVRELNAAKSTVLVQAYSFTSAPIAKALVDAHKRGVKVEVILDKSQRTEKYSSADFMVNMGIPTKIDAKHAIAHNKIMVIDGADGHHGQLQLHQGRREPQRREPVGDPQPGTRGQVHGQLAGPCPAFRPVSGGREGLFGDAVTATAPAPAAAKTCRAVTWRRRIPGIPQA